MPGVMTKINMKSSFDLTYSSASSLIDVYDSEFIQSKLKINTNYPYKIVKKDRFTILILGAVYNVSMSNLIMKIECIADSINDVDIIKEKIFNFNEDADGDYIIQIIFDDNNVLIFNDSIGRLPLYYSESDYGVSISSEIKDILILKDKISVSKNSMLEFIMYEYQIGTDTLYTDINKLDTFSMILFKNQVLSIFKISDLFQKESIEITKDNFLNEVVEKIQVSVSRRIKFFESNCNIVSDISGGLDSRVVAYFTSKYPLVNYQTFEYVQDESAIAMDVLRYLKVDVEQKYKKLVGDVSFSYVDFEDYIYINDALVNFESDYICSKDLKIARDFNGNDFVRFTGLGISDYLRKYPYSLKPIIFYLKNNKNKFGVLRNLKSISLLLSTDEKHFENKIKKIGLYLDKVNVNPLLVLYFDFQRNYVSLSAEDRERNVFWTVPSMYTSSLFKTVAMKMSVKWVGYRFFYDLMKKIDPNLLLFPLFNRRIDMKNKFILIFYDFFNSLRFSYLSYFMKGMFKKNSNRKVVDDVLVERIRGYVVDNEEFKSIWDNFDFIYDLSDAEKKRLLTILVYLDVFKVKFGKKIELL